MLWAKRSPQSIRHSSAESRIATAKKNAIGRWRFFFAGALILLVGGVLVLFDWWSAVPDSVEAIYVGRESCWRCHEQECRLWEGSDHDLAMDHANETTVLGDFNNATFTHIAFSDLHRFSDGELRAILEKVDDKTLAIALQPYEAHHGPEAFSPYVAPSGQATREKILHALPPQRAETIRRLMDWYRTFARPCDITAAHRILGDAARDLLAAGTVRAPWAVTSRFYRRDNHFYVETDDQQGKIREFKVDYVFGVYPLQQYLVTFPDGRVQCLPLAWDVKARRWFHLYPSDPVPSQDPLHWTRSLQNWNYMCAECHTTNLQKNYDVGSNTYQTTWSEIDVSCETCHGPASIHVRLAQSWSLFWDRKRGTGLVDLSPRGCDNRTLVDSCAPCHSRRRPISANFQPGKSFLDYYIPEFLDGTLYYPDGQILDEDYEYGSFIQSLMYRKGVRCTDCHDAHTGRIKFAEKVPPGQIRQPYVDNRLCGQCHLPSKYDTPQHHHHPDTSKPGSRCVDCHMPETTYMVVDARRDHSLRVPRPDLTVALGIPNACNICHQDPEKGESPQWAAEWIEKWYGPRSSTPHFAFAFDRGRKRDSQAVMDLIAVVRRQDMSAMVRASAVLLLAGYGDDWVRGVIMSAATDQDPLVRLATARALQNIPLTQRDLARIQHLLRDPVRSVRVESVPWALTLAQEFLSGPLASALRSAVDEYRFSQQIVADQPGAHMNLALLAEFLGNPQEQEQAYLTALKIDPEFLPARNNLAMFYARAGRMEEAEKHYLEALKIAPDFVPARDNLARLYYQMGRLDRAEEEFRRILEKYPDRGDIHYSLGLLLAEQPHRMAEAASELLDAARLLPGEPRVLYNTALALQKLGKVREAEEYFARAYRLGNPAPDLLQAYALCLVELGRCAAAQNIATELVQRYPGAESEAFRRHVIEECGQSE